MDPSTSSGPLCARPAIPTPSSTKTPYELLPLLPADIARCVELYFAALHSPQLISRWPHDLPSDRQWTESAFACELSQPGAHWLKAVIVDYQEDQDDHSDGSSIVAFAKWQECPAGGQNPSTTTTPTASPTWPAGTDTAACDETLAAWTPARTPRRRARKHTGTWNSSPSTRPIKAVMMIVAAVVQRSSSSSGASSARTSRAWMCTSRLPRRRCCCLGALGSGRWGGGRSGSRGLGEGNRRRRTRRRERERESGSEMSICCGMRRGVVHDVLS